MNTERNSTLSELSLPADLLEEMETLNREAASLHIWLRTRANAPQKNPWHLGINEEPPKLLENEVTESSPPPVYRASPYLWKWTDIEPYLHRIADIAPLEFTDRQQFLLLNPTLGGALRVTNTIRVAISIYKPGDKATTHMHTPNASRTILSNIGGYTTVEGEVCEASRGDLILTPNGTWHGHGNNSTEPVIWMDVLDWPLMENLDCIWIEEQDNSKAANTPEPSLNFSSRHYGKGGLLPTFLPNSRGIGVGSSPLMHYKGMDIKTALEELAKEDGNPYEAIQIKFTNPTDGSSVFTTLGYSAQLLRPGESTLPCRQTSSTLYCCMLGHGYTEIAGTKYEWNKNDIFLAPNYLWRHHVNLDVEKDAILYAITDAPLLEKIGHFRAQGKTMSGDLIDLNC